jgi:uncharacterized UBP type Zn finger protein
MPVSGPSSSNFNPNWHEVGDKALDVLVVLSLLLVIPAIFASIFSEDYRRRVHNLFDWGEKKVTMNPESETVHKVKEVSQNQPLRIQTTTQKLSKPAPSSPVEEKLGIAAYPNSCYMNATLQMLRNTPSCMELLHKAQAELQSRQEQELDAALQKHDEHQLTAIFQKHERDAKIQELNTILSEMFDIAKTMQVIEDAKIPDTDQRGKENYHKRAEAFYNKLVALPKELLRGREFQRGQQEVASELIFFMIDDLTFGSGTHRRGYSITISPALDEYQSQVGSHKTSFPTLLSIHVAAPEISGETKLSSILEGTPPPFLHISILSATVGQGKATNRLAGLEDPIELPAGAYQVTSFITHLGATARSGHYIAYAKKPDGSWYEYNDARVKKITAKEAEEKFANAVDIMIERIQPS